MINEMEKNPNPTKDQHFMVDKNMLERIYETANIQPGESICEIGGGAGALTDYLIQGDNSVTVIEKDPYYANLLKEKYAEWPNVNIIEGDALNYDYSNYDRVVANLPYTITEPLLINLAQTGALNHDNKDINGSRLKSITLVLSQNSVRKMVAPVQISEGNSRHQNSEFGIMSAITQFMTDLDIECAIPSECFFPEPAVTSFLVNLKPKKKKTTVDRIMTEFLVDKKGKEASLKSIYSKMIYQNKIYKVNKYKNNSNFDMSFTSKNIENKNIYELNNNEVSTLAQNLITNDMKKKNTSNRDRRSYEDQYRDYMNAKYYNYDNYDEYDDYDEYEEERKIYVKEKHKKVYDYLYDSKRYLVLLNRGLEYLPEEKLQSYLTGKEEQSKAETKNKRLAR
jgi:16S rRNA (adenine1518-N6/adenine1519-N6)-dimethyltransferase